MDLEYSSFFFAWPWAEYFQARKLKVLCCPFANGGGAAGAFVYHLEAFFPQPQIHLLWVMRMGQKLLL
jgi:hypothetical protein